MVRDVLGKQEHIMLYLKNLSGVERTVRIVAGGGAAALAYTLVGGTAGLALAGACAGLALSGIAGFCPMCVLAGRRPRAKP